MGDRMTRADVERSLIALGSTLEYPPAPAVAPTVTARLLAERAAARRPPFPGLALWPRRRILLLAVAGLLLLLAGTAVATRLAIGAIQIRVVRTPPASTPPVVESGTELGERVTLEVARARVGFPIVVPEALGPPAEVHVAESVFSSRVVVLVWDADAAHPPIEGTPWSTILMELPGSKELASKEILAETTLEAVRVGSHDAYWISGPHQLTLLTPEGEQRLTVTGNVLLWEQDGTTLRLETALPKAEGVALAESIM